MKKNQTSYSGSDNKINTEVLPATEVLPIDNLTTSDPKQPLSSKQGKILKDSLDSEISTRSSADSTLQGNINSEASTRSSSDQGLQNQIDNLPTWIFKEVPSFTAGDTSITLAHTPVLNSIRIIFNKDLFMDATIFGSTITFPSGLLADDEVFVDYQTIL
jgi:hypothetical protein